MSGIGPQVEVLGRFKSQLMGICYQGLCTVTRQPSLTLRIDAYLAVAMLQRGEAGLSPSTARGLPEAFAMARDVN